MTVRDNIVGRHLFDVFPDNPADPNADGTANLRRSLNNVLELRRPDVMAVQKYDIRRPAEEGGEFEERFWSPVNSPVLTPDGAIAYVIHRVEDVTEYVRLRQMKNEQSRVTEELRSRTAEMELEIYHRAQKLAEVNRSLQKAMQTAEAASRSKSEFLANMSHEIRTPMNGIIGMTELALGTDLTAEQRRYLDLVKGSADALLTLLNDILDFSKIEAGRLELDPQPFSLRDTLCDALQVLAAHATPKRIELLCHVPTDVPDMLVGDAGRLRQIMVNLVGNAIKFTQQGEVRTDVRCEQIKSEEVELTISVQDTGIGIPSARQASIFETFTQGDISTSRQYGGTGLGLAISATLVKLMRGRIWLDSLEGQGSTFTFTVQLPLAPVLQERAHQLSESSIVGLPVLVVDDNAANREILEEMLGAWGMRVDAVATGQEALDRLDAAHRAGIPYPLALLDVIMPEPMDGFQLARHIRSRQPLRSMRVIMLSSARQMGDASRTRELGIDAFLMKPVKQSELLTTILSVLSGPGMKSAEKGAALSSILRAERPSVVLVAEDNAINQALVSRLLEKRGHNVLLAGNGQEALEILERTTVDVLVTDVQMPLMDGYALTAAVRQREDREGGRRLPIIAMTANAMKGDDRRCIEAGMDAYIPKPIHAARLFEAIERWSGPSDGGGPPRVGHPGIASVVDEASLLERVDGNREFLGEVVDMFNRTWRAQVQELREAIQSGDGAMFRRHAHSLVGTVGAVSATEALQTAQRLDDLAREGQFEGGLRMCEALEAALGHLERALSAVLDRMAR